MKKNKHSQLLISQYYLSCNILIKEFMCELYGVDEYMDYYQEGFWVGAEVGEIWHWGDYFVGMNVVVDYFELDAKPKDFFMWYDLCLEQGDNEGKLNFKNYLKRNA